MMYEMIYKALKEVGLENKYEPQDYLNFFCLGNREALDGEDNLEAKNSTAAMTPQVFPLSARVPFQLSLFQMLCFHLPCIILSPFSVLRCSVYMLVT